MSQPQTDSVPDRRSQILDAALVCFAKRGFHVASMHDISAEAGISVGLIYRYFQNKEAVISAMADSHKKEIQQVLESANSSRIARNSIYFPLLRRLTQGSIRIRGGPVCGSFTKSASG